MATDLLARGAAESRKRAAVLRQLAAQHRDDSLLTPAATADAEAALLEAVSALKAAWHVRPAAHEMQAVDDAADALARLLVKED